MQIDFETRLTRVEAKLAELGGSLSAPRTLESLTIRDSLNFQDSNGKLRLTMRLLNGSPVLRLWGDDGQSGVYIGVEESSSEISLKDNEGNNRFKSIINSDREPWIALFGNNEEPRATLSLINDSARLMLHSRSGEIQIALSAENDPHIQIYDTNGNTRVNLSMSDQGPIVCITDENQKTIGLTLID